MGDDSASPAGQAAAPARRRRRLPLKKRLLFLGVTLVLGGLLTEGVLRLAGFPKGFIRTTKKLWATDAEKALGPFRPDHEARLIWPPELAYTVTTNDLGLRGPALPAGRPVVLCVGDSTTFGQCVQDDETYPALLQRRLDERGLEAAVANGGCPRWTITDQRPFLQDALPALEPRVVLLMFCGNDLFELDKDPARGRALEARDWWWELRSGLALPEAVAWASLQARRAYLDAKGEWPQPLRADQGKTPEVLAEYWDRYAEHLAGFAADCEAAGARLIVGAFPGFEEVDAPPGPVERNLPGLVEATGAEYLDLYAAFRASDEEGLFLLPHDAHASAKGNAVIADAFAGAVAEAWAD